MASLERRRKSGFRCICRRQDRVRSVFRLMLTWMRSISGSVLIMPRSTSIISSSKRTMPRSLSMKTDLKAQSEKGYPFSLSCCNYSVASVASASCSVSLWMLVTGYSSSSASSKSMSVIFSSIFSESALPPVIFSSIESSVSNP